MADVSLDIQERLELCDLFDELGPAVPTLLEGWTAHDLAAHIVLRERDLAAGVCIVLVAECPPRRAVSESAAARLRAGGRVGRCRRGGSGALGRSCRTAQRPAG